MECSWQDTGKKEAEAAWLAHYITSDVGTCIRDSVSSPTWAWLEQLTTLNRYPKKTSVLVSCLSTATSPKQAVMVVCLAANDARTCMRSLCCGVLLTLLERDEVDTDAPEIGSMLLAFFSELQMWLGECTCPTFQEIGIPLRSFVMELVDLDDPEKTASAALQIACRVLNDPTSSTALAKSAILSVWSLTNGCYPYRYHLRKTEDVSMFVSSMACAVNVVQHRCDGQELELLGLALCALNWIGWDSLSRAIDSDSHSILTALTVFVEGNVRMLERTVAKPPGDQGRAWDYLELLARGGPSVLVEVMMGCGVVAETCKTAWRLRNVEGNRIHVQDCPHVYIGNAICFLVALCGRLGPARVIDDVRQFNDLVAFTRDMNDRDAFRFWHSGVGGDVARFLEIVQPS